MSSQISMSFRDQCDLIQSFRISSSGRSKLYAAVRHPLRHRLRAEAEEIGLDPDEVEARWMLIPFRLFWRVVNNYAVMHDVPPGQAYLELLGTGFDHGAVMPHLLLTGR